jgi:hypothetical protein
MVWASWIAAAIDIGIVVANAIVPAKGEAIQYRFILRSVKI